MLCVINKVDQTNNVPYESISISTVAGDQAGQAQFQVIDPGATLNLSLMQEVIFIDETATYGSSTSAMIPTENYLAGNNFNYGTSDYVGNTVWAVFGTFTSQITFPSNPTYGTGAVATLTFNNQAVGYILAGQNAANGGGLYYVTPGQTYCLSGTVNVTNAFTNSYAMLKIGFLDGIGGTSLASQESTHLTATGSQRLSVSLTAPAGAVCMRAEFGGVTTTTTNSGTATFTALQLEPKYFPALYSYPTPICDLLQADTTSLFVGTARFDRSFCGNITDLIVSYEGNTRTYDVTATALDGWLENSNLLTKSYSSANDSAMISDAILPVNLSVTFGLATGNQPELAYANMPVIYTGVSTSIDYADATPREVFNQISDMTGFIYGVDAYYNAFYCPPHYNAAPYGFSSSPDNSTTFPYYDYSIEYDGSQLQNIINASGGTYSLSITEAWSAQDNSHGEQLASGKTVGWNLFHTPNAVPTSVVVGGTTLNCQLGTNNGWGSATALSNTSNPQMNILTGVSSGTSISVTYPYNALVYVQTQSPDSIGAFGRGLFSKINDTNLTSNASAATRGEAQLFAYSQSLTTIKFKTTKMLNVGQVVNFTSALDGLTSAHFAIQKVTATCLGAGINQYEIQAGSYIDDFVDFFRNSQKAINRAAHNPNDPIKQYNLQPRDSLSISDGLNIHT